MDSYGDRYSFVDTVRLTNGMRKPHVHTGLYITVTRRDDGSLRPNVKPVRMEADFTIDAYAINVCNELRQALKGLAEEG